MFTKTFQQINKNDARIAGGKGASLGEMTQVGISVPAGFVVLATTFDQFIREADLIQEIEACLSRVDHKKTHTIENASEKIQALIKNAKMPDDIALEIKKEFRKLNTKFVAVRSSATAEDGAEHAWAGQLDSYLNITEKNVLEKVQHCWASLFTSRAIFYRFEKNLHTTQISVAVVVQKMVNSEKSGIAFSVHPIIEDPNQLIIEAGFGLGEAIVSGQITPDSYVVKKEPREILDINVSSQSKGLFRNLSGGNVWKDLGKKGETQVLNEKEILELSKLILKIENHYGFPCDIEWAYARPEQSRREKGKFYITQSRPITTLKSIKKENNNKKESFFKKFEGLNGPFGLQMLAVKKINDFTKEFLIQDKFYFYKDKYLTVYVYQDDIERLRNYVMKKKNNLIYLKKLNENTITAFNKYNKKLKSFYQEIEVINSINDLKKWIGNFIDTTSDVTPFGFFAEIFAGYDAYWLNYIGVNKDYFTILIAPEEQSFSKMYKYELAKIKLRKSQKTLFEIAKEYYWVLNNYFKTDIVNEKYIRRQLKAMTNAQAIDIESEVNSHANEVREKKKNVLENIKLTKDKLDLLSILSAFIVLQDKRKEIILKTNSILSCACNKLLNLYDFNEEEKDIILSASFPTWFEKLSRDELLTQSKRSQKGFYYSVAGDMLIGKDAEKKLNELTKTHGKRRGTNIVGQTVFPGIVKGRVLIVIRDKDFTKFKSGDILVASMTRPEFGPIMKRASAFVTDEGGITCHAAIVAREMKKPCIIGTKIATEVLHDGDLVEVNANEGIVRILERNNKKVK